MPAVLAVFGVGSFIGIRVAARFADANPRPLLAAGGAALLGGWVAFALAASNALSGAAREAPDARGSLATASLNVGAAAGPWLGGVAIAAGLGLRCPCGRARHSSPRRRSSVPWPRKRPKGARGV